MGQKRKRTLRNVPKVHRFYPKNPFFLIGGCSFIVLASATSKSLCSLLKRFGTCTCTVKMKSP